VVAAGTTMRRIAVRRTVTTTTRTIATTTWASAWLSPPSLKEGWISTVKPVIIPSQKWANSYHKDLL